MEHNKKLTIFKRDGSTVEVEPIPMWSPCHGDNCNHPSHKKESRMRIYIDKGKIEDYWLEINKMIAKAADFIGTDEELISLACIEVALDYAETIKQERDNANMDKYRKEAI
jgi:hypothetical protein